MSKQNYGCGVQSVARALNMPEFETKYLEKSKDGDSIYQLNKWLDESTNVHIEPLFFNLFGFEELPMQLGKISPDTNSLPILIVVRKDKSTTHHMNSGYITTDGKFHSYDESKTFDNITEYCQNKRIYSIFVFVDNDDGKIIGL